MQYQGPVCDSPRPINTSISRVFVQSNEAKKQHHRRPWFSSTLIFLSTPFFSVLLFEVNKSISLNLLTLFIWPNWKLFLDHTDYFRIQILIVDLSVFFTSLLKLRIDLKRLFLELNVFYCHFEFTWGYYGCFGWFNSEQINYCVVVPVIQSIFWNYLFMILFFSFAD